MFSKTLSQVIVAASLLLLTCVGIAGAEESQKATTLSKTNSILESLLRIGNERRKIAARGDVLDEAALIYDVNWVLKKEKDPDVLLVSLIYMHPGRAEDQVIDNVFDEAWRACIRRIEGIGGKKAIATLESIQRQASLDGLFSSLVRESLERLRSLK